jgi:ABC-type Na+ transport system ATPase subunit NatA
LEKDKTGFLSTHIIQRVEAICDGVVLIMERIVTDKKLNT